jgi:ParB/RepB/Spo0J family partition protein
MNIPTPHRIVETLPVDEIFIGEHRRPVNPETVEQLTASIGRLGLFVPISVRNDETIADPETGEIVGGFALVTGRHRLEAFRKLGIERIPAIVMDGDEIDAELWEIAENLHRADLTKDERDRQIRRYADLLTRQELQSPQIASIESKRPDKRGHRPKGIAAKIADETGLSKDTVARALNPKPAKPRAVKPVSPAPTPLNDIETKEQWLASIMRLWNRASKEWREEFMARIDGTLTDAHGMMLDDIPANRRRARA